MSMLSSCTIESAVQSVAMIGGIASCRSPATCWTACNTQHATCNVQRCELHIPSHTLHGLSRARTRCMKRAGRSR